MRIAIQEKIGRIELSFLKEDGRHHAKRKMAHQLADYLITNLDHLIAETPDFDGGLNLHCCIEFLSDLEKERIFRDANFQAFKKAAAEIPKIIDDFGNEIENTNVTEKLRRKLRGAE